MLVKIRRRLTTVHSLTLLSQETLRTALAMGADRAVHVNCGSEDIADMGPLTVSNILAKLVQQEKADLVILGKQVLYTVVTPCLGSAQ